MVSALPDARGHFDAFGGKFVPEALWAALAQLEREFLSAMDDPGFGDELARLLAEGREHRAEVHLTAREREVLAALARGRANREIARHLGVSEKTVKTHVSAVRGKLGVQDRTQAALYAVRHGIVG